MDPLAQTPATSPAIAAEQAARMKELASQTQGAGAVAGPAAKVGTDQLQLTKSGEFQYFGHAPQVTVTLMLKQPIWADDRTKITFEQWQAMPEKQQQAILKLIPRKEARKQFLSGMNPDVVAAKEWLGKVGHGLATAIANGAARVEAQNAAKAAAAQAAQAAEATQAAQVDRLNALVEGCDK